MSVASIIDKKGIITTSQNTRATLKFEGFTIAVIHLSITGSIKGLNADEFATVV